VGVWHVRYRCRDAIFTLVEFGGRDDAQGCDAEADDFAKRGTSLREGLHEDCRNLLRRFDGREKPLTAGAIASQAANVRLWRPLRMQGNIDITATSRLCHVFPNVFEVSGGQACSSALSARRDA
jgi:hypothetical protein